MRSIFIAASLLTVATFASAAPVPVKHLSFAGAGELVHEGLLQVETADVSLNVALRRVYMEPPLQLWTGQGALVVHTTTRHFAFAVDVRAQMATSTTGPRDADAIDVSISSDEADGAIALAGLDGFLRGAGAQEIMVTAGPDAGRYDLAFIGLARVVHS